MATAVIIGAGIGGLAAASKLAEAGYEVTVLEKNSKAGGRINVFKAEGFTFDMGPSWYWMPEVFENFYNHFGYSASDFYDLVRLDPSYRIYYKDDVLDVPADFDALRSVFEDREPGSGRRLEKFIRDAEYKYSVGMSEFVWKPGRSISEFLDMKVFRSFFKLQMFSSVKREVASVVSDRKLQQLLEFPVLFLGAAPQDTPALYSLMNYADLKLGTWYPMGGMYGIAEAFYRIALSLGVSFRFNETVTSFDYRSDRIHEVLTDAGCYQADIVLANADYHHIDQNVVSGGRSQYSSDYWERRKMAPSSLLFYLGIDRKLAGLRHHNLFFDADFNRHADQIYKNPGWPEDPLFYVCAPSITDPLVAPDGMENLFVLIPLAPGLKDGDDAIHEQYLDIVSQRIEERTNVDIREHIIYKKSFGVKDFKSVYNAFKGNAYGLANTLNQTAVLKPALKSKNISNLYFAGQLTTPGPGLPPSIISGQVAAREIINDYKI